MASAAPLEPSPLKSNGTALLNLAAVADQSTPRLLSPVMPLGQANLHAQVALHLAAIADNTTPPRIVPESHSGFAVGVPTVGFTPAPTTSGLHVPSVQVPTLLPMPNLQAGIEGVVVPGAVIQSSPLFQPTNSMAQADFRSTYRFDDDPVPAGSDGGPWPMPAGAPSFPGHDISKLQGDVQARNPLAVPIQSFAALSSDRGATARATARVGCALGLGATFGLPTFVVPLGAGCTRFESWVAQSLEMATASREFLDEGTYRRIKHENPAFVGWIGCMPSALMPQWALDVPPGQGDELWRDSPLYLVTRRPEREWALKIDMGRLGLAALGLPYLAYDGFAREDGAPLPLDKELPPGFEGIRIPVQRPKVMCFPRPLAMDPELAVPAFAEAVEKVCRDYHADGVRLDDLTATYSRSEASSSFVKMDVERLRGVSCETQDIPPEKRYAFNHGANMYSDAPYVRFHPEQFRGRFGPADVPGVDRNGAPVLLDPPERTAARALLCRSRLTMLRMVSKKLEARGAAGKAPTLWPNMHPLLGLDVENARLVGQENIDSQPFDYFYAANLGPESRILERGGWWEKFGTDWNPRPRSPYATVLLQEQQLLVPDSTRRRIRIGGVLGHGGPEVLSIYRARLVEGAYWQAQMKWVSKSLIAGAPVQLEAGFTSIDEIQFPMASALLCGLVTRLSAQRPGSGFKVAGPCPQLIAGPPVVEERVFSCALPPRVPVLFPRFIHPSMEPIDPDPDHSARPGNLDCGHPRGGCTLGCGPNDAEFHQKLDSAHPTFIQDVIAGPNARLADVTLTTPLRLLLDVVLGDVIECGTRDYGDGRKLFFARFELGEVVAYPIRGNLRVWDTDLIHHTLERQGREPAYYMAVDADTVDALVDKVGATLPAPPVALTAGLPSWTFTTDEPLLVVRRVLEAGLQDAGEAGARSGIGGICLRRVECGHSGIPLLPGMGKVIVYGGTPTADQWLGRFPLRQGARQVPS